MHISTEMLQFFAQVIIMGTIHYPKLEDDWTQYWPLSTLTFFRLMSRNCFSLILKFLHINDKKDQKQKVNQDMIDYIIYIPLLHH